MTEEKQSGNRPIWFRNGPITVLGVLTIGILGSALYDLIVRPGISTFGRLVLNLVTLGSKSLRDAAYASAALDPTPVSALLILEAGLALATVPVIYILIASSKRHLIKDIDLSVENDDGERDRTAKIAVLRKKINRARLILMIVFIPYWLGLYVAYQVHSQSVVIWRVFHADVAILTPEMSALERDQLLADFAGMKSHGDYVAVYSRMNSIAYRAHVKLRDIETW